MAQNYNFVKYTLLASTTATTTVDITGFGFDPKAIRVWWNGRRSDTDAVGLSDCRVGCGIATGSSNRGYITIFYDQGTTNCIGGSHFGNGAVYAECDAAASVTGAFDFSAFITDGVRLICDDQITADIDIVVEGWGGSDITNVYADVRILSSGTTGDKDYTDIGFTPSSNSLYFFAGTQLGYTGTVSGFGDEDIISMSVGSATPATPTQYVIAWNSDDDIGTMDTDSYMITGEVIASIQQDGGASPDMRVTFVQNLSGGFRLNVAESPGFDTGFLVLILSGGSYALGDFETQDDTTTAITENVGFAPSGVSFFAHCDDQSSADTAQAQARFSIGHATSPSNRICLGFFDENNTSNMETATAIEHDAVYVNISLTATVAALCDVTELPSANGFAAIMDDAETTGAEAFVYYEAYGGGTAPGGGQPPRSMHQYRMRPR